MVGISNDSADEYGADEYVSRYDRIGQYDGLTKVGQIELSNESYRYDLIGLWKDEDGGFYLGTDSGCSCPTPWENTTRDDLTGPLTSGQAFDEASSLIKNARDTAAQNRADGYGWDTDGPDAGSVRRFLGHLSITLS